MEETQAFEIKLKTLRDCVSSGWPEQGAILRADAVHAMLDSLAKEFHRMLARLYEERSLREIEVVAAGLKEGPIKASRGVVVVPDTTLDEVAEQPFDMVVLPGGMPGAKTLGGDPRVKKLLERMRERQRWIAAICAAPAKYLENPQLNCGFSRHKI